MAQQRLIVSQPRYTAQHRLNMECNDCEDQIKYHLISHIVITINIIMIC